MSYEWMDVTTERRVASAAIKASDWHAEQGAAWFRKYVSLAKSIRVALISVALLSAAAGFCAGFIVGRL